MACAVKLFRTGICFSVLIAINAFLSCSHDAVSELPCWATMEALSGGRVAVRAGFEDGSGDVPTGAKVLLVSPANEVTWLRYDSSSCVYSAILVAPMEGDYRIDIQSVLGRTGASLSFKQISGKPSIISMQDGAGAEVGTGRKLRADLPISISWRSCGNASVYQVRFDAVDGGNLVLASSEASLLVEPGTLAAGATYSVVISAQYIYGDPYLRERNTYAYSFAESSEYSFSTE